MNHTRKLRLDWKCAIHSISIIIRILEFFGAVRRSGGSNSSDGRWGSSGISNGESFCIQRSGVRFMHSAHGYTGQVSSITFAMSEMKMMRVNATHTTRTIQFTLKCVSCLILYTRAPTHIRMLDLVFFLCRSSRSRECSAFHFCIVSEKKKEN